MSLPNLPTEIVLEYLSYLDYDTLLRFCQSTTRNRHICYTHQNELFTNLLKRDFELNSLDSANDLLAFAKQVLDLQLENPVTINEAYTLLRQIKYKMVPRLLDQFEILTGNPESLESLVKLGFDINSKDSYGEFNILMDWISELDTVPATRMPADFDFNYQAPGGMTVLMMAIEHELTELSLWLIREARVNTLILDSQGFNAIMYSVLMGDPIVFKELLKYISINSDATQSETLLMFVISQGPSPELLEIALQEPDLNLNVSSQNGETVLYTIIKIRNSDSEALELFNRIIERGIKVRDDIPDLLITALKYSKENIAHRILDLAEELNELDFTSSNGNDNVLTLALNNSMESVYTRLINGTFQVTK